MFPTTLPHQEGGPRLATTADCWGQGRHSVQTPCPGPKPRLCPLGTASLDGDRQGSRSCTHPASSQSTPGGWLSSQTLCQTLLPCWPLTAPLMPLPARELEPPNTGCEVGLTPCHQSRELPRKLTPTDEGQGGAQTALCRPVSSRGRGGPTEQAAPSCPTAGQGSQQTGLAGPWNLPCCSTMGTSIRATA